MQRSLEGEYLINEVKERGYAEFNHHIRPDEIDDLIVCYANFTSNYPDPEFVTIDAMLPKEPSQLDLINPKYLDPETKDFMAGRWLAYKLDELDRTADTQEEWHKYRTNTPQVGKPDGYSNRSFAQAALLSQRGVELDPPEDPKEFYHFTPEHYSNMIRNHTQFNWGPIPQEVIDLKKAFTPIHSKAAQLMVKICEIIEDEHPGIRKIISDDALRTSPVRLLFYHPNDSEMMGAGHYDKTAGTLQIAESHRGLRVAPSSGDLLEPVVRGSDEAAFFPGSAIDEHMYPGTPYQPGWHDIIRTDILNEGRSIPPEAATICARWALIFFANYENFIQPDKTLTHTR